MNFSKIVRMFEKGSVCVCGQRGDGKDMLMANVVCRRKLPYVSNVNYRDKGFNKLEPQLLDCGMNTYQNFISGDINYYEYPYEDGTDIYISDVGVYYPSQYCNELNKRYPYFPTFLALSRHLGDANVHINVQNFNRAWDKIREQSDLYVYCLGCHVFFGKTKWLPRCMKRLVFQRVRIYEKAESCEARVPRYRGIMCVPFSQTWQMQRIRENEYYVQHGQIKELTLIYFNRSNYNTRIFKEMLKNGKKT